MLGFILTDFNPDVAEGEWDRIIGPNGPVEQGASRQLWKFRDLLFLLVKRDMVAFYKQTVFGPLWFLILPVLTTSVYMIVFGQIARMPTGGVSPFLFYFCGVSLWAFFGECLTKSSSVFRDNADLFGKVYFPRLLLPLSIVLSNTIKFSVQFCLFLLFAVFYGALSTASIRWQTIFLPLLLFNLVGMSFSIGTLLAAAAAKYRDLLHIIPIGVQLLMYATPVVYMQSTVPLRILSFLRWNPLSPLFEAIRFVTLDAGAFSLKGIAYSTGCTIFLFCFAVRMFGNVERSVVDTV